MLLFIGCPFFKDIKFICIPHIIFSMMRIFFEIPEFFNQVFQRKKGCAPKNETKVKRSVGHTIMLNVDILATVKRCSLKFFEH